MYDSIHGPKQNFKHVKEFDLNLANLYTDSHS